MATPSSNALGELARLFLRLGATAFGGPLVHIAMMEEEVVRRRGWLTREQFLDYVGAVNLIPGPNSTELAIHIGYLRAGWRGLLVAGASFILPATLIVTALAWVYVQYGSLPAVMGILYGVKPVVIAIVGQALWALGRTAVRSVPLALLAAGAGAAVTLGVGEIVALIAAGCVALLMREPGARDPGLASAVMLPLQLDSTPAAVGTGASLAAATGAAAASFGLLPLFLIFLKIGAILFGSGYVLIAFLESDLVERLHWLTEQQLLDATAVGQVTPGPVFTTATFVGFILGGPAGAAVATIAIFLPAFVLVAASGALIPRIRRSPRAGAFLDGVNVASLALMGVVTAELARSAIVDGLTLALAALSAVLLLRYRVNSTWVVLAGALAGLVAS